MHHDFRLLGDVISGDFKILEIGARHHSRRRNRPAGVSGGDDGRSVVERVYLDNLGREAITKE